MDEKQSMPKAARRSAAVSYGIKIRAQIAFARRAAVISRKLRELQCSARRAHAPPRDCLLANSEKKGNSCWPSTLCNRPLQGFLRGSFFIHVRDGKALLL